MNKKTVNLYIKKLFRYWIFFLLALYVIFFVWSRFDNQTKQTHIQLFKLDGIKDFKLWMDIAGWVRLTYKLNFSEYKQVYTNKSRFEAVKQDIINVISKKIDERISKLWVSDYKVYNRVYDDKDYLIVEIWWVNNLEEAKKIIWKTVTLSFKVPFDQKDPNLIKQREQKVKELYQQVLQNPNDMEKLASNADMVDVYYHKYDWVSDAQLPKVYDNIKKDFFVAQTWKIYPLQFWEYHETLLKDGKKEIYTWWTIIRFLGKKQQNNSKITIQSVNNVAVRNWKKFEIDYSLDNYWLKVWEVAYKNWNLLFNAMKVFTWEEAYKLTLYQVAKPDMLWKKWEELKELQKKHDELVKKVKEAIESWKPVPPQAVQVVDNQRVAKQSLLKYIPDFNDSSDLQVYDTLNSTFIAKIYKTKKPDQDLYVIAKILNVPANQVEKYKKELKNETLYQIEEIFVKDMPTWQTAIDPVTKEVLDAKYFQYANVWATPTWSPMVQLHFNDKGQEIFCHISENYIWKPLAIFVWDSKEPVTVATIKTKICWSSPYIEWNFSVEKAKKMADDLNDWAFPVKMTLESQEKISPILWSKALVGAIYAWVLWVILIALFLMLMYWWKKALVWFTVLVFYTIYLLAILKIIWYAFSLSWIAAIILALWMAVDANILIFERVREELAKWKTMHWSIDVAVTRSRAPIRDWNVSTWLIALILALNWMSIFRWFGSMIIITMLLVLFINVELSKTLLHVLYQNEK